MTTIELATTQLRPGLWLSGTYVPASPAGRFAPGEGSYVEEDSLRLIGDGGGPVRIPTLLAWLEGQVFTPSAYDLAEKLCWAHEHPIAARKELQETN